MKLYLFIVLAWITNAYTQDNFMEAGVDNFSNKESYFNFQMGLEQLAYESHFDYNTKTQNIKDNKIEYINMTNLKIGRDYNYKGYVLGLKIGGFYGYSDNNDVGFVSKDIDVEAQSLRSNNKIFGTDIGAHIAFYKAKYKKVYLEPFLEFTTGVGRSIFERNYSFENNGTIGDEFYNARSEETFSYNRWSAGVNLVSYKGIYSFFKVTQSDILIRDRKLKGESQVNGGEKDKFNTTNDVNDFYQTFSGSLGFGLFF